MLIPDTSTRTGAEIVALIVASAAYRRKVHAAIIRLLRMVQLPCKSGAIHHLTEPALSNGLDLLVSEEFDSKAAGEGAIGVVTLLQAHVMDPLFIPHAYSTCPSVQSMNLNARSARQMASVLPRRPLFCGLLRRLCLS